MSALFVELMGVAACGHILYDTGDAAAFCIWVF